MSFRRKMGLAESSTVRRNRLEFILPFPNFESIYQKGTLHMAIYIKTKLIMKYDIP